MINFLKPKILLFMLIFLVIVFYQIKISENRGFIEVKKKSDEKPRTLDHSTIFYNVEYNFSNYKRKSLLKGDEATIEKNNPNLINLKTVSSQTVLNDSSTLNIKSTNAKFFKNTKNVFFFNNVIISNKDMIITAENANYVFQKNTIKIFNNVILKNSKNIIKCDSLLYNTETKNIELMMNASNKQIYGNRKK